ncbi:hypothetical protein [Paenarthrobacter sp. PH39-S1]|uniref:hypothetical protein n=1 Tax=Paenarthrobacter sp. PH39-S1 TaxID=3046204 RepID=UPI0024BB543F|nr:hypothetical protein [Paenarthrobacter sp. PH39-S1]MDJ0357224.1 hypothetical protein [Paenarthrobacter sp. PH39-S1]
MQHLIREDLPISLVMAGIPKAVSDLLNEDVSTFLRRADQVDLRDVPIPDVRDALATTFSDTGVTTVMISSIVLPKPPGVIRFSSSLLATTFGG